MTREEMKQAADQSWGQDAPKPERQPLGPVWPSESLEKEMLRDALNMHNDRYRVPACECHIKALLCRVRDLERALLTTGYFQSSIMRAELEGVYTLLEGVVPTERDGRPLWLRERVEMLIAKATERTGTTQEEV